MSAKFTRIAAGAYRSSNRVPVEIHKTGSGKTPWIVCVRDASAPSSPASSGIGRAHEIARFGTLGDAKTFALPLVNHPQGVAAAEGFAKLAARKLEGFGGHARARRHAERMDAYLTAWRTRVMPSGHKLTTLAARSEAASVLMDATPGGDGAPYFVAAPDAATALEDAARELGIDLGSCQVWGSLGSVPARKTDAPAETTPAPLVATARNVLATLAHDHTVTDAETTSVIEWCREWARDTFEDFEACEHWNDGAILRRCHLLIDGGLAFVLADVRRMDADAKRTAQARAAGASTAARMLADERHAKTEAALTAAFGEPGTVTRVALPAELAAELGETTPATREVIALDDHAAAYAWAVRGEPAKLADTCPNLSADCRTPGCVHTVDGDAAKLTPAQDAARLGARAANGDTAARAELRARHEDAVRAADAPHRIGRYLVVLDAADDRYRVVEDESGETVSGGYVDERDAEEWARELVRREDATPSTDAYNVTRLHSGTEDGALWYVTDASGAKVSGDGHAWQESALAELDDIRALAELDDAAREAVAYLRMMCPAPGDYGLAVIADGNVREYRTLDVPGRDRNAPATSTERRSLIAYAIGDYRNVPGAYLVDAAGETTSMPSRETIRDDVARIADGMREVMAGEPGADAREYVANAARELGMLVSMLTPAERAELDASTLTLACRERGAHGVVRECAAGHELRANETASTCAACELDAEDAAVLADVESRRRAKTRYSVRFEFTDAGAARAFLAHLTADGWTGELVQTSGE